MLQSFLIMTWKKKVNKYNLKPSISISKKLKEENKINHEFEVFLSNITLEDIIALKLEIAARNTNGMLYGIPIWKSTPDIVKEAMLKAALSICQTKSDAASFLGVNKHNFSNLIKKYNIEKDLKKDIDT